MTVIALTQEMGSLAKEVAFQLAQTQNLTEMHNEVIDYVADKMHMAKSAIRRLREGKAGMVERLTADESSMAMYMAEEIFQLAQHGNVVLRGWGATCLLRPVPHVVCVRITRPLRMRVDWLMSHLETDDAEFAESEIRRSDSAHASRMNSLYGVNWGDPLLFDLVLNTERLSVDSCVEQIMQLASRPEFQETEESIAMMANLTLVARIRTALKSNASTHETNITIESDNGRVKFRGIVQNKEERADAEKVALAVPGVSSVDNQLRLMAGSKLFTSAKYF